MTAPVSVEPISETALAEIRRRLSEYHLPSLSEVRSLLALLDQKAGEIAANGAEIEAVRRVVDHDVRLMDPPDGGDPTTAEKVGNLRRLLTAAEADNAELRRALEGVRQRLFGRPNGKLTILCLAYNAFMRAGLPNTEDGGIRDWFNDTLPELEPTLKEMRLEFDAALSATSQDRGNREGEGK